jgi:antitoxin component of MazEF toxin-antitoxin module
LTRLKITAKGRITLKPDLLKHLGVSPGEEIETDKLPNGQIALRAARKGSIDDFFGCLSQPGGPKLTIEEICEFSS